MTRPSWDTVWVMVARDVGERSRCVRAKIGAVIVDPTNRIVATGYTGPPAGMPINDGADCRDYCRRAVFGPQPATVGSYSDCVSVHAELNALMWGDRREREGGTMYTTGHLCWTCAKAIANSGLARVVVCDPTDAGHREPEASYELLRRSGLTVEIIA